MEISFDLEEIGCSYSVRYMVRVGDYVWYTGFVQKTLFHDNRGVFYSILEVKMTKILCEFLSLIALYSICLFKETY